MKKWQDNQHVFNEQVILDNYRACKEEFISKVINDCPYFKDINGIYLTVLYLLDRCSIIPIRLLTRFVFNDTVKYLANVIGGKGVGLAILLANGFRIPPTYIIPVGSLLGNRYLQYLELLKINTFAVRSSATVEDNINHSFAGMFVSCLDVNRSELTTSIDMVKESLYSERVKKYISHFKTRKPYMAVILQRYRKPQFSGVWMGQEEDSGSLEWIYGKGEELVSGKVTPKREVWSAKTNNKDYLKINDEFIGKNCLLIQEKLNFIADIEWCAVNNRIIWLQLRPVTRILMSNKSFERKADNIYGISTSSGIAVGKPVFLKSIEEKDKIKSGDILLADYTDPDWLPIMIKCSGVVTAEGGALSHTAIISRELGIPCIVGIGYENIDYLKTANLIEIDGSTGSVEIQ